MLVSMAKVEIIGPKKDFYDVLSYLHQLGNIHIEDMSKKIKLGEMLLRRMEVDEETADRRRELEALMVKISSILTSLESEETTKSVTKADREKYYYEFWRGDCDELKTEVDKLLGELEEKTRNLAGRKETLEREQVSLAKYETIVEKIKPLAKQLVALEGFETVALLIDRKYKAVLDLIRSELSRITKDQFEVVSADIDEETTAALVVFNKIYSEPVHSFLWAENVNQVRLPDELSDMPFDEALLTIKERRMNLPAELDKVREELSKISKDWLAKLLAIRDVLNDRCKELQAVYQFGQTDYTFVIEGWIPRKAIKKTEITLQKEFGERIVINEMSVSHHELEEAPVFMENPSWARPFEVLMNLLQKPRYGTIDPTPIMAIFFPVFFGLMLGDVAYGVITILLAYWIRKRFKSPMAQSVGQIFYYCGVSSAFFGIIYGEIFGNLGELIFHHYHWEFFREFTIGSFHFEMPINRIELAELMIFLTIGLGFGHIILGLVLGVINAVREKAKKHIFENIGMIVFLLSAVVFGLAATKFLPAALKTPSTILLMVGFGLLIYGGGMMGVLHIFGTTGNILSYVRLMAIGLSGAILANVSNQVGGMGGNIILGIFIASIFHAIALILGIFSPSIHSFRLHLVEFFGKFYQTGGKEYHPFKRTGGESVD